MFELKKHRKAIFVYFTSSDWSKVCLKFQKEVLDSRAFLDWSDKNVVLLKVDFPHQDTQDEGQQQENKRLLKKYRVRNLPTVVMLNEDGKEMGRLGYCCPGVTDYIKRIEKVTEEFRK